MTEQDIVLKRFEADGKGVSTDRKKKHVDWDTVIRKGREKKREQQKNNK